MGTKLFTREPGVKNGHFFLLSLLARNHDIHVPSPVCSPLLQPPQVLE